eukprot:2650201-Pyramimonas_sp.AAC.1
MHKIITFINNTIINVPVAKAGDTAVLALTPTSPSAERRPPRHHNPVIQLADEYMLPGIAIG